jgi:hypothetical protein
MCGKYLYDGSRELNVAWNERRYEDSLSSNG